MRISAVASRVVPRDAGPLIRFGARAGLQLSLPIGFAFVQKRGDAFVGIAPQHVFNHHGGGVIIGLIHGEVDLVIERAFADFDGSAKFGGKGFGEGLGFLCKRFMWHVGIDQAKFNRAGSVDEIASGQHFKGGFAGNVAGQGDHGGGTEQADVHTVDAEFGACSGHGHMVKKHPNQAIMLKFLCKWLLRL